MQILRNVIPACIFIVSPTPSLAQISAEEIWQEWVAFYAVQGFELSATSQSYADGTLRLNGVTQTYTDSNEEGEVSIVASLDEISLREETDDSVSYILPEQMTVLFSVRMEPENDTFVIPITMTLENFQGRVSGDDTREYQNTADTITINVAHAEDEGSVNADFVMNDLASLVQIAAGLNGPWDYSSTGEMSSMSVDFSFAEVASNTQFTFEIDIEDITLSAVLGNFTESSTDGFLYPLTQQHRYSAYKSETNFSVSGNGEQTTARSSTDRSAFAVDIAPEAVAFKGGSLGFETTFQMAQFPIPFGYSATEIITEIAAPLFASELSQPLALKLALRDVAPSESVWTLIDPLGALGRDPVDFVLDIDGSAKSLVEAGDIGAFENFNRMPFELDNLTLNQLLLSAAGAVLTGNGDVDFKNEDSASGLGFPQPFGKLNFDLKGGLTLIDKLVTIGVLPAAQAQMAKMMSGVVATPVGEDHLTSEIELTEDGSVLVNGLPSPF